MHETVKRGTAFLLAGLFVLSLLVISPQTTGEGRAAEVTITIKDDTYPNLDNQNFVPVAVNNTHRFSINLENTGDVNENYTIEAIFSNAPDGYTNEACITQSDLEVELDQGANTDVWVDITTPPIAKLGDMPEMEFTITGVDSGFTDTTTISAAVLNWTAYIDGKETFEMGDDFDYDLTIVNLNQTAAFEASNFPIELLYPGTLPDWTVTFPQDSVDPELWPQNETYKTDIPAGGTVTVDFNLKLNDNVEASSDTTFLVQAYNTGDNDPEVAVNNFFVEGHAEVLPFYLPSVSVAGSSVAEVDSAGGEASFELTVSNYGNDDDSFTISTETVFPGDGVGWDSTLDNDQTEVLPWKGANGMETFNVTITAPALEEAENEGVVTVTVTSDSDDQQLTTRDLKLTITQDFAVSMTPPAEITTSILPGGTGTFAITVNNGGNGDDTIGLAVTGDSNWLGDPALTQVDVGVTELEVGSYDSDAFMLNVKVPADALTTHDSGDIMVTATSENLTETTSLTFTVNVLQTYGINVLNGTNATTDTKSPGGTSQFSVLLENNGNGGDTITFAITGCDALECKMMDGSNEIANAFVDAGDTRMVTLSVDIPADATLGDYTLTVTGSSTDAGTATSSYDFTLKVEEDTTIECPAGTTKNDAGQCVEDITEEDDDDPGFELVFAVLGLIAALGVMRRR